MSGCQSHDVRNRRILEAVKKGFGVVRVRKKRLPRCLVPRSVHGGQVSDGRVFVLHLSQGVEVEQAAKAEAKAAEIRAREEEQRQREFDALPDDQKRDKLEATLRDLRQKHGALKKARAYDEMNAVGADSASVPERFRTSRSRRWRRRDVAPP